MKTIGFDVTKFKDILGCITKSVRCSTVYGRHNIFTIDFNFATDLKYQVVAKISVHKFCQYVYIIFNRI